MVAWHALLELCAAREQTALALVAVDMQYNMGARESWAIAAGRAQFAAMRTAPSL
jgi:hypothetical protein